MEGTARYFEYSLYSKLSKEQAYSKLVKSDTLYGSNSYFKNYSIDKDDWLYLTTKSPYFYVIGFNISRLLDTLNVDYKDRLFNEDNATLESILRELVSI